MTDTIADQLDLFGDTPAGPLTRGNTAPETVPAPTAKREPSALVAGGLSTRRYAKITPRVAAWVALDGAGVAEDGRRWHVEGGSAGALLDGLPADVRQVYVVGERPGRGPEGFRSWADATGERWAPAERGHWLHQLDMPTLRYAAVEGGREVEVCRAATWYDAAAGAGQLAAAHVELRRLVAERFDGAPVLATPSSTGRDLWLRTIPEHGWPRVTDEVAELIRSTSGQHRQEVIAHGAGELAQLVEVDGRFMYAALCRGLPAGIAVRGFGEPDPIALGYGAGRADHVRGRYLCRWQVPADWAHVGLLPEQEPGGGWRYPRTPGAWCRGWLDGAELQLARRWGWTVTPSEYVAWPAAAGAGPLDSWASRLVRARADAAQLDDGLADLVAAGVRSILLHGLGAMHGRAHLVTRTAELHEVELIPEGAIGLRSIEGRWSWAERAPGGGLADAHHPEWTAAVWARERVRVLDGPGATSSGRRPTTERTGALHVPYAEVVGFAGDAIYLTSDPRWSDDGRPGRLRTKRVHAGPHPAPATRADLLALLREVRT